MRLFRSALALLTLCTLQAMVFSQAVKPYRLRKGDIVILQIYKVRQATTQVQIDGGGMVTGLFLKPVRISGMSIDEAKDILLKSYSKALQRTDLRVSVILCSNCSRKN